MTTHGFELLRDERIEELNSQARLYRHIETGAELLSIINDDENKVFGVTFRTPPKDSTGVPHIMEHSVLCGSRKYPLKEPFIELVKGSLHTFLNAMTYPDKTVYPVASQNLQDFYNLVDVYLDAVFFPKLTKETLLQEGWHYELEDPSKTMTYKGVVFNEMKGVYSSPDSLLYRYGQQTLLPDSTYGVDSGGDPAEIPHLTYEQFKAFHETYYHPSNARFFFYGDAPEEPRLKILQSYLSEFSRKEVHSEIVPQPRFDAPRRHKFTYEAGENDQAKAMMTVSWLLPEKTDRLQTMLFGLLSYILVDTPASPLRKALLDSGLGEEQTGGGLITHMRQMAFSSGLKGINPDDCDKIEALILETLQNIADEGIEPDMLEAAINMTEFHLRENNTGSYPRGLSLMLRAMGNWLYDRDPIEPLRYEDALQTVKTLLADSSAPLQELIREHLLENPHRVTVLLTPEVGVQKQREEAEAAKLRAIQDQLDEAGIQKIIEQTKRLKQLQETPDPPEVIATLPSLTLDDLDRKNKHIPLEVTHYKDAELLYHDLFTNGIIYLDLGFDLRTLPQAWLPYVSLFGKALVEIGTKTEDDVKIAQRIRQKTGGIWTSSLIAAPLQGDQAITRLLVRSKVAADKADDLLSILHDLLLTANFDNQKLFGQMVRKAKANFESAIIPNGHGIVNGRLRARLGGPAQITEYMTGIDKLFFLRELTEKVERDWPAVLAILEGIRSHLIHQGGTLCNVTTDAATWQRFEPALHGLLDQLPVTNATPQTWHLHYPAINEGLTLPAQVNYVAKGANLYDLGYQLHGSVSVITNYLRTSWLWEKVRVQGGAYGGMCQFSRRTGVFTFLSYRDPNILQTLEAYDQTGKFLRELTLDNSELTRSIIGTIGTIDDYQLPDAKGYTSMLHYLTGESDDFRQTLREQILSTTIEHFHQFGEVLEDLRQHSLVVVLGAQEAIEKANANGPHTLKLHKVM